MTLNNFVSGFKNSEKINLISVVNNLKMGSSSDWSAGFKKVVDTEMGKEFPNIKSRPLQNVPVNHADDSNYNSSTSLISFCIFRAFTKAQTRDFSILLESMCTNLCTYLAEIYSTFTFL